MTAELFTIFQVLVCKMAYEKAEWEVHAFPSDDNFEFIIHSNDKKMMDFLARSIEIAAESRDIYDKITYVTIQRNTKTIIIVGIKDEEEDYE